MRVPLRSLVALFTLALAPDAFGQFAQYTPPGGGGAAGGRGEAEASEVDRLLDEARWRVGPFRMAPFFGLENLGYVDNAFAGTAEGVSDVTATAGAGLAVYLPTGPDVVWVAEGELRYFWWQELEERRNAGGRVGAGLIGDFNRLGLDLRAGRELDEKIVTSEIPQRALVETDFASADATLRLGAKTELHAGATVRRFRDHNDEIDDPRAADFAAVDRDETLVDLELTWSPTDRWEFHAGAQLSEVAFEPGGLPLDNSGTAPVVGVDYDGPRFAASVEVARRSLDPEPGSRFVPFDEESGSAELSVGSEELRLILYGNRDLVYSLTGEYDYFTAGRWGLRLAFEVGHRTRLALFGEQGENDYTPTPPPAVEPPGAPARTDDVTAWGGQLSVELGRLLRLQVGGFEVDYDSNLPGLDRTVTTVTTAVSLSTDSLIWR